MEGREGDDPIILVTGGEENLVYCQHLGQGGYGMVHKVLNPGNAIPILTNFGPFYRFTTRKPMKYLNFLSYSYGKYFARKVIPYDVGKMWPPQVPQEAHVVDELFVDGRGHENLVKVKPTHGWIKHTFSYHYYIDMELCDFNLSEYIRDEDVSFREANIGYSKQSPSDLLNIASQLISGVVFIHQHGMVHRDLTPKNVLYSGVDKNWKIADFGLTVEGTSSEPLETYQAKGTTGYRAPELILPDITPKAYTNKVDIWGLGCIIYELATGIQAFPTTEDIRKYAHTGGLFSRARFPFYGIAADFLFELMEQMFRLNPNERIEAEEAWSKIQLYHSSDSASVQRPYSLHDRIWLTCVGEDIRYVRQLSNGLNSEAHLSVVRKLTLPFVRDSKTIRRQRKLLNEVLLAREQSERCQFLVDICGQGQLGRPVWYYIDMEPCTLDLEKFINNSAPTFQGERNIWKIMLQIGRAVDFIHKSGIIIRDLKPSRVLYSTRLESTGWKIGDFSQVAVKTPTKPGQFVRSEKPLQWTEGYRAPEVVTSHDPEFNEKVDIWGMGCILYKLINQRVAFKKDYEVVIYTEDPSRELIQLDPYLHSISGWEHYRVKDTILKMFAVSPETRPPAENLVSDAFEKIVKAGGQRMAPYSGRE